MVNGWRERIRAICRSTIRWSPDSTIRLDRLVDWENVRMVGVRVRWCNSA